MQSSNKTPGFYCRCKNPKDHHFGLQTLHKHGKSQYLGIRSKDILSPPAARL